MLKLIVTKFAPVLLVAALLASCAAHVKIENSWTNQNVPATSYKKLLVVAVAKKATLRTLLENILAETLSEHGVAAVASHKLITDITKADKVQLQTAARAVGADAVLITQGLSREESTGYRYFGGSVQERTAVMFSEDEKSSTVIAMSAVGVAPLETDYVKGSLQTRLFNTASAEMAWSALTEVINDGRKADACWDFSIDLTKALAKAKQIEVNDKEFKKPSL